MSRFAHEITDSRLVAYGLDHAVGYFAQVFIKGQSEPIKDVTGRNAVLELFESEGIDKDINNWHIVSMVMDLPIASSEDEYNANIAKVLSQ